MQACGVCQKNTQTSNKPEGVMAQVQKPAEEQPSIYLYFASRRAASQPKSYFFLLFSQWFGKGEPPIEGTLCLRHYVSAILGGEFICPCQLQSTLSKTLTYKTDKSFFPYHFILQPKGLNVMSHLFALFQNLDGMNPCEVYSVLIAVSLFCPLQLQLQETQIYCMSHITYDKSDC